MNTYCRYRMIQLVLYKKLWSRMMELVLYTYLLSRVVGSVNISVLGSRG